MHLYIIYVIPTDIWQVVNLHILKWCSENNRGEKTQIQAGQMKVNHAITKTHMENICMAKGWKKTWSIFQDTRDKKNKNIFTYILASGDLLINVLFGYVCK